MSAESQSAPETLTYNFGWATRTFTDRSTTEALLAPERDEGNVSYNDYQAAVQFSGGLHRFYRVIGGLLGVPLTIALRRPSWSPIRQATTVTAHINFVRSLENPEGFGQALRNIQEKSGLPVSPGITLHKRGSIWILDANSSPIESSPTLSSTPDVQKPSINPPSKWDQIRAVNTRSSTNSSWDALRESHERTRVPPVKSDNDFDTSQRSRDDDRAAEQARFNEMLERERNIKDDS